MRPSDDRHERTVAAAVAGDRTALLVLLTEGREALVDRLASRIPTELLGLIDADDVVQEVHVRVFRSIESFTPRGTSAFDRWVATITLNRLRNWIQRFRAIKRGHRIGDLEHADGDSTVALFEVFAGPLRSPSSCVAREEAINAVEAALGRLPEDYQHAVRLVYIDGRPVRDTAEKMGRTERAVHGLCRRGLELLKREMGSSSDYLSSTG